MQPSSPRDGTRRFPPEIYRELSRYYHAPRQTFRPYLTESSDIRGTYFTHLPRELREVTEQYRRGCDFDVAIEFDPGIPNVDYHRTPSGFVEISWRDKEDNSIIHFNRRSALLLPEFLDGKRDQIWLGIFEEGSVFMKRDDANIFFRLDSSYYTPEVPSAESFLDLTIPLCNDLIEALRTLSVWFRQGYKSASRFG